MKIKPDKQKLFQALKKDLESRSDFKGYLSQKILFDGRKWTVGQFIYKCCFDEFQPFAYYVRDHFDSLRGREKVLAERIKEIYETGLTKPKEAYRFIEEGKSLNLFDEDKQAFYQNLFADIGRSEKGNPCYWHPVSQCQTAFIEYKLSQMGMSEKQIRSLMIHCEKEREKAEQKAIQNRPKCFIHNTVLSPDEIKGGKIDLFIRSDDHFLNFQKMAFIGVPNCFHAGLTLHTSADFALWPRFNPNVFVFQTSLENAKKQICTSYNYRIDMRQKKAIRPCIPLWGGAPLEWVSVKPLSYTDVRTETLRDLIAQGKEIYLVPVEKDWKKYMEKTSAFSPEQAAQYMKDLADKYPDKFIRLDFPFLAEYEAEDRKKQ